VPIASTGLLEGFPRFARGDGAARRIHTISVAANPGQMAVHVTPFAGDLGGERPG